MNLPLKHMIDYIQKHGSPRHTNTHTCVHTQCRPVVRKSDVTKCIYNRSRLYIGVHDTVIDSVEKTPEDFNPFFV